jgi:diacylglycerol kinase (ATP)
VNSHFIIINPNAGSRRGIHDWPAIARLLDASGIKYEYSFTNGKGEAGEYTAKAIEQGIRNIIVTGGDGTLNEAVNGLFMQTIVPPEEVTLAMIPVGTGNDWGRTYGMPNDHAATVKMIRENHTTLQDVGIVSYIDGEIKKERYFINVAGIGFDAVVTSDTNHRKERGSGGKIAYMKSLLLSLFKYSHQQIIIEADGLTLFSGEMYSANAGICKYSGGGMMQVPFAIPDDGMLDITIFRKMGKLVVIRNTKRLYDGSFVKLKYVSTHRAERISFKSNDRVLLEVDGESIGSVPAEFRILPKALKVVVPIIKKI